MKNLILSMSLFLFCSDVFASFYKVEHLKENVVYLNNITFQTEANLYRPITRKSKAIIYLFPTISGPGVLEKSLARYFVHRGFAVIIPDPVGLELNIENPDTTQLDRDFFKPTVAASRIIEAADKKLKSTTRLPIFALGASQGGIRAIGLTAENERVRAAWFAVAGGNFPKVYATSQVEKIKILRKNHMALLGMTDPDIYEQYLRENLKNDPLYSCAKISAPIVQVIALEDNKVPTETQIELQESCPPHETIRIDGGHVKGVSTLYFYRKKILDFFSEELNKH